MDDAAGFVVGGIVGLGTEAVEDYATGHSMTWGDAAGSFVSGGIVGVGAVNAPETGGISFAAAVGGGAGFAGNLTKQLVDMGTGEQKNFSGKDLAVSTVTGAVVGGATQGLLKDAKIPGLSSGRGNASAVGRAARTRIANGNAKAMSVKTAIKAEVGSQAVDANRTAAGAAVDTTQKAMSCQPGQGSCK